MESAIPAKAWRSFLFRKTDDVLFTGLHSFATMLNDPN